MTSGRKLPRWFWAALAGPVAAWAADAPPPASVAEAAPAAPAAFDVLARFADGLEHRIFPGGTDSHYVHWLTFGLLLLAAILLRRVVAHVIFKWLRRLAAKTETTLDDKLLPALEAPVATLVMVLGIFAALSVFRFSPGVDRIVGNGFNVALIAVLFWGIFCAGGAILDHMEDLAHGRQLAIATFMPLIKKTLAALVGVIGLLTLAQSFGADVKAALAGLGIGGLAVAFAAQDTIANLFGSLVVVLDQPFKVGEVVKIGATVGTVEDIGLRSTKLRLIDRSLAVLPNKLVAAEVITNLSRFTQRRVEQTLGLPFDTPPEQVEGVVTDIRRLLAQDGSVDPTSVLVYFSDYGESSLNLWMVYVIRDPDFAGHLAVRQRLNLAILRIVDARGLALAFPTQTMHLPTPVVEKLAPKPP